MTEMGGQSLGILKDIVTWETQRLDEGCRMVRGGLVPPSQPCCSWGLGRVLPPSTGAPCC